MRPDGDGRVQGPRSVATTGTPSRTGRRSRGRTQGAPNVLVVVLDDVGFAQLGCFGSDIDTPNLDRLAANGLRYANFHTTALCSPTRACLLTGRNHHAAAWAASSISPSGFPGYDARIPRSCALLPAMLTPHGYAAYAVGKWHLTPEDEKHLGARRDRWPLGRGFERWYGFFGGETHQFVPALVHDNHFVDPPAPFEDGYHLTEDLADRAIEFLEDLRHVDVDKPWLPLPRDRRVPLAAPGAGRLARALPRPVRRGLGRVARRSARPPEGDGPAAADHTELSPRPDWVPAWDDLGEDERRVSARYMEAFAAFLSHADAQIGRVLDRLDEMGELDNTLVIVALRQRRVVGGRPDRVTQRRPGVERAAQHRRRGTRAHRRDRRAAPPQQLPVGLDGRRQHAVPALEARDPRRRRRRPADRSLAARHRARGARCARSTCTRSTSCRPCSSSPASTCPQSVDGSSRSRSPA